MTGSLEQRADLLTVLMARNIPPESVVVMGTSTPLTAIASLLALELNDSGPWFTTPLAGGMSVLGHQVSLFELERAAFDSSVMRSTQIIDLWEMGSIGPRTRTRWLQFFRPAQMDAMGNMNNSVIGPDYARPRIRLPGSVGIGDMAAYYTPLYAYVTRHNRRAFPHRVDFVSAPGTIGTVQERVARGLRWGRPTAVFTDLCVLGFDERGRMRVSSVHPDVTQEEVREATGFDLEFDKEWTEPPSSRELDVLRQVDPGRLRDLEFVTSRERRGLIQANLSQTLASRRGTAPTGST
jgi:glutaconate CoA-transferase subunit B